MLALGLISLFFVTITNVDYDAKVATSYSIDMGTYSIKYETVLPTETQAEAMEIQKLIAEKNGAGTPLPPKANKARYKKIKKEVEAEKIK